MGGRWVAPRGCLSSPSTLCGKNEPHPSVRHFIASRHQNMLYCSPVEEICAFRPAKRIRLWFLLFYAIFCYLNVFLNR